MQKKDKKLDFEMASTVMKLRGHENCLLASLSADKENRKWLTKENFKW